MNDSTRQLCETLLWSECDSDGVPLDKRFTPFDICSKDAERLSLEFDRFVVNSRKALSEAYGDEFRESDSIEDFCCRPSSGKLDLEHNFILARNSWQSGFCVESWEVPAQEVLRNLARAIGEVRAYARDGKLFIVFH